MSNSTMGAGTKLRQWLMTGVSYMIPFVAAGGILIGLAFWIGGYDIALPGMAQEAIDTMNLGSARFWGGLIFTIGAAAFNFLGPVLSGFIAYAIADRPGLVPGFVGGMIAWNLQTGFLGAMLTGLLAGAIAYGLTRIKVPSWLRSVMPIVFIPLISTFVIGAAMYLFLATPIANLMAGLETGVENLAKNGALPLVGIVIGLMMAFDMGGPINKVAYAVGTGLLANNLTNTDSTFYAFVVMAIVMAAGMTPPLGLALATVLRRKLFSKSEYENGKAAWFLGASFITEGAIPFAAADPIRVIPSIMIGSAFTGALVGLFGVGLRAPHGGIWVFPLVSNPWLYILAVVLGSILTALLVIIAKNIGKKNAMSDEELEEAIA